MLKTTYSPFNLARFTALTIIAIVFSISIQTAQAADASNYSMLAAGAYTATARVDESIGMRASASIGTAVGITPMETRLIRAFATMDATNSSTLPVVVTPYARYTLNKVVVAAIATITHTNGTKDAVKDIQTYTTSTAYPNIFSPSPAYTVPDFSGYVKSGDNIDVEIVMYADLTYATATPLCEINLNTGTGTLVTGVTLVGNVWQINTADIPRGSTIRITGTSANQRQIYVYNSAKGAASTTRDVHLVFDGVQMFTGGATSANYTTAINGSALIQFLALRTSAGTLRVTDTQNASYTPSYAQVTLNDVDVYATFINENILATSYTSANTGYPNASAILVDASASLIITDASTGSLYARGGGCSAAIGSSYIYPAGYVEIDGGTVTATSAHNSHAYAGIGNGGHYSSTDPGMRGFVMNGGDVEVLGFHYGIGANGSESGNGATTQDINADIGAQYIVITGGNVISEGSAGSGGAALGFGHNNDKHEVRIGRPDKSDTDSYVFAVNWGYGAAISGKMTFYSGTTSAYSGQYAAAIGGNAVSYCFTSNATTAQAQSGSYAIGGTPLTIYGGNVTAESGAYTQETYGSFPAGVRGINNARLNAYNVLTEIRPNDSYGAAIGGSGGKPGGSTNYIFAGTFNVTSGLYGAGIGGGGVDGSFNAGQVSGDGGDTWIGNLTNKNTGAIVSMSFTVNSGQFGAGIGGGGSGRGAAGSGGKLYIAGGSFNIQSGLYGAGIGGGGSLNDTGGSGGDLFIDCKTDESMVASWNSGAVTPGSYNFNIKSGQFGAGIGGGGSNGSNGGAGATTLTINGGNFNIEAGGNTLAYNTPFGSQSYGAGIGGGGSYSGNGGNGPANAEINGGYFNCSSVGYGAGIGGGGTYTRTGGGGGLMNFNGGTAVVSIPIDADGESIFGSVSVGGGHANVSAGGISNTANGEVFIRGGSIYSKIKSSVNGDATQHAWTLPLLNVSPYNTASTYIKVEVPAAEIGKKVDEVTFSYNGVPYPNGSISYGTEDLYILAGKNSANADIGIAYIWVPTEFLLTYNLTSGASAFPYPSPNDFDIAYANRKVAGTITLKMAGTSQIFGNMGAVPLLEWDQKIQTGQEYYGTTWGDVAPAKNFHLGTGNKLYELTKHAQVSSKDVYLIGWTADHPVWESDGVTEHIFGVGDGLDFSKFLITEANFLDGDIEVFAMWGYDTDGGGIPDVREPAFTLSYDGNAGSNPVAGVPSGGSGYKLNDTETIPVTIPSRTGYVFLGWTKTAMSDLTAANAALIPATASLYIGGSPATRTFGSNTVTGVPTITFGAAHITLYALWAVDVNANGIPDFFDASYSVTYDANGGSGAPGDPVNPYFPGLTVTVLPPGSMSFSGYKFTHWNTAANGSGTSYNVGDVFTATGNITLYAQWQKIYTVTYNANGGSGTLVDPNSPYMAGVTVKVLDQGLVMKENMIFVHWNTKPDGSGVSFDAGATFVITQDTILYALWRAVTVINPYRRLITIEPSVNGRIESDRLYAATGDTVTLTILPEPGYVLSSLTVYRTDDPSKTPIPITGNGLVRTFLMPPSSVVVTATFKLDDGTGIGVVVQPNALNVYVKDGILQVGGLSEGQTWRVYNITGMVVYQGIATGSTAKITLPARGVYIVTDGKKVLKTVN